MKLYWFLAHLPQDFIAFPNSGLECLSIKSWHVKVDHSESEWVIVLVRKYWRGARLASSGLGQPWDLMLICLGYISVNNPFEAFTVGVCRGRERKQNNNLEFFSPYTWLNRIVIFSSYYFPLFYQKIYPTDRINPKRRTQGWNTFH